MRVYLCIIFEKLLNWYRPQLSLAFSTRWIWLYTHLNKHVESTVREYYIWLYIIFEFLPSVKKHGWWSEHERLLTARPCFSEWENSLFNVKEICGCTSMAWLRDRSPLYPSKLLPHISSYFIDDEVDFLQYYDVPLFEFAGPGAPSVFNCVSFYPLIYDFQSKLLFLVCIKNVNLLSEISWTVV